VNFLEGGVMYRFLNSILFFIMLTLPFAVYARGVGGAHGGGGGRGVGGVGGVNHSYSGSAGAYHSANRNVNYTNQNNGSGYNTGVGFYNGYNMGLYSYPYSASYGIASGSVNTNPSRSGNSTSTVPYNNSYVPNGGSNESLNTNEFFPTTYKTHSHN
jgi:hypothetical protein